MKFDLALDVSRDVFRDVFRTGEASPSPPPSGSAAGGRSGALPVLRAVVPPGVLAPLLARPAARGLDPAGQQRDTLFIATLPHQDTLVVPHGARVVGDLEAPSVHVLGSVLGRVTASHGCLVVDRRALVQGSVWGAGTVVIAGQVRADRGKVAAVVRGNLRLAATARIEGRVYYRQIEIYEGAQVAGALLSLDPC